MVIQFEETEAGVIGSLVLSLVSMGALSVCFSRRVSNVRDWSMLPPVCWLILVIYIDSMVFVGGSAILSSGFGVNSSYSICRKALLLCLSCYMTTKFIYYFLVERAYIIRRSSKPRHKDKLYLFNSLGMLLPYCVVIALNFYFRFANYENNICRIGMKRVAMIPLIGFDILVNVYLTSLFLIPLRSLYSYKNNRNSQARTVALRTFIGSCCTLTSSIVNLTVVMVLNGEPGWICLMCCNIDILFSVLVLHWITSRDNASTLPPASPSHNNSQAESSSPRRLVPRTDITAYEIGLREFMSGANGWPGAAAGCHSGRVTTSVTAIKRDDEDELVLERIGSLPPGVVSVETEWGRVVEIEGEAGVRDSGDTGDRGVELGVIKE